MKRFKKENIMKKFLLASTLALGLAMAACTPGTNTLDPAQVSAFIKLVQDDAKAGCSAIPYTNDVLVLLTTVLYPAGVPVATSAGTVATLICNAINAQAAAQTGHKAAGNSVVVNGVVIHYDKK